MHKKYYLPVVWILVVSLVLGGCGIVDVGAWLGELDGIFQRHTSFSDIAYSRPDIDALVLAADGVEDKISQEADVDSLMDGVQDFYDRYHEYYTNYALANIYYCKNMTDIYWEQEYNFCLGTSARVDALLDRMLYALADSPQRQALEEEAYFGEGFFDPYEGESLWDDAFTALMEQEAVLEGRYYELSAQALQVPAYSEAFFKTYGAQMTDLLVELVQLRQRIAKEAGYENYLSFAYEFYYYRDYTPAQSEILLQEIQKNLVPLYRKLPQSDLWENGVDLSSERSTFGYVKNMAKAMGGDVKWAFDRMDEGDFYDISQGEHKYDASFEVFLPKYAVPYVFVNPAGTVYDQLTFAHEFGHFCKDYTTGGSVVGIDVAEVFSQGMEYLSLCYGGDALEELKMADSLSLYVEQAGYASFEQQLYTMEEPTAEKVYALYDKVGKAFGFDAWQWDNRSFVCIPHFFTDPLYVISYVVSNDAAMQLYRLERERAGSGLAIYQESLTGQTQGFLAFLEETGLETPFVSGRLETVAALLDKEIFG